MRRRWIGWAAVVVAAAGCVEPESATPPAWREVSAEQLSAAQQQALERARAGIGSLGKTLRAELQAALTSGPAEQAVAVCRERAPQIAEAVAREQGLEIGRTSFRIRNPDNRPPAWAADLVAAKTSGPRLRLLEGDRLGVLQPIVLEANCLLCHGPAESIPPGLQATLRELYPRDEATGFRENEVRGYFWVSVPLDAAATQPARR
jgi:hypothetical protein